MTPATRLAVPILLCLGACISVPKPKVKHLIPPPTTVASEPIPMRLGVHYATAFERAWWAPDINGYALQVGQDSATVLRQLMPRLFREVAEITAPPPFEGAVPAVDLVLVPWLGDFEAFVWSEPPEPWHALTWRFAAFTPTGELVATWKSRGARPFQPGPVGPPPERTQFSEEPMVPMKDGETHAGENLGEAAGALVEALGPGKAVRQALEAVRAARPGILPGLQVTAAVEDQRVKFPSAGGSLMAHGFVPVRVKLANTGAEVLRLDGLFAQLTLSDGRLLHQVGPGTARSRLMIAVGRSAYQNIGMFGAVGAMASSFRARDAWLSLPELRERLSTLELQPVELAPGGTWEGILLFLPQEGAVPPGGPSTFSLWLKDAAGRQLRSTLALTLPAQVQPAPSTPSAEAEPGPSS